MEVVAKAIAAMVKVVETGAMEVVGGVRVRGGRPCFFGLPLPCLKPDDPRPTINDPV